MKVNITKELRIRKNDNEMVRMIKVFHVVSELVHSNKKFKAVQWLMKLATWMTLNDAYSLIELYENNE